MSSMSSGEFQVTFAVNDLLVLPNVVLQGTWVQNLEVEFVLNIALIGVLKSFEAWVKLDHAPESREVQNKPSSASCF